MSRLDIGDQTFIAQNAHGQPIDMRVNAQTATHAEGGAFQEATGSPAASRETRGVLFVDRELCKARGDFRGVESMAKELGLLHFDVYMPSGLQQRFSFSMSRHRQAVLLSCIGGTATFDSRCASVFMRTSNR